MKNTKNEQTSNTEMVSISRAEYEEFQAQGARISALEKQVELLMEAVRLSRKKQFGSSSERLMGDEYEQLSILFNEAEVYLPTQEKKPLLLHIPDRNDHPGWKKFCRRQFRLRS